MAISYWTTIQVSDTQMKVPAYRGTYDYSLPTETYFWQEDAACAGSDPELWEPQFNGRGGFDKSMVIEENETRLAKAKSICNDCPVWHLCYQDSQSDDFWYTMRAGIEPVMFTKYKEEGGRPRYHSNQEKGQIDTCKNGHNNWRVWGKQRPRRVCVDCDLDRKKAKRDGTRMV